MDDRPAPDRLPPHGGPPASRPRRGPLAESSRVEAFSDGVFAIAAYAASALCAAWYPIAGLTIASTLPVFYGLTSAGWRSAEFPEP